MTKAFGKPDPLTPTEQRRILAFHAQGLSVTETRRKLLALGHRRGDKIVRAFLHESNLIPHHARPSHPPSLAIDQHQCVFCDWRGPHTDYYGHWRTNHRTRAGLTRRELEDTRHA